MRLLTRYWLMGLPEKASRSASQRRQSLRNERSEKRSVSARLRSTHCVPIMRIGGWPRYQGDQSKVAEPKPTPTFLSCDLCALSPPPSPVPTRVKEQNP